MKHIKTYKTFESLSRDLYNKIKLNLEDILLEVNDSGYSTDISYYSTINSTEIEQIDVSIKSNNFGIINIKGTKDTISRLIDYMKIEGLKVSRIIALIDNDDFEIIRKEVDLFDLYNDVYDINEIKIKFIMNNINVSFADYLTNRLSESLGYDNPDTLE